MKKRNWIEWLMHNYRLTFLLFAICFALGFIGIDRMAKAEFPDFVIRQGVVVAVYPGATAEEVEEQVARPLERYLFTFNEIKRKKTTSTSSAGMCMVMVELNDDVDNKDEVWSKIRHGINGFKSSLPKGVLGIVVDDDFGSTSALLLAIESDRRSYRELKEYTDELADRLRRIPAADNVQVLGEIKEQISIYVDRGRLSAYGIGQMQLMQHLQAAGLTTMSGNLQNGDKDIAIHVKPSANSIGEIENTIIFTDNSNHVVRVKDIAIVKKEYDKSDSYIEFSDNKDSDQRQGKPSIVLSLEMKPGNNIVQYGEDVGEVLRDFEANYLPADVKVHNIADQCKVVEKSVVDFLINLVESMLVIIIVMILLFPWRTAVVAGCIVPLNTLISVGIMYLCGIPLNTVTFAGLIIVMGMVVDNAIVVLDGYLEYLGKGLSRWHAAVASARKYFMPMALATMCLCAIFFPFLFVMVGMAGDMVEFLPWTIAINLAVSLLLAVAVIPILEVWLVRLPSGDKKKDITDHVQSIYEKVLSWTFRNPWTTIMGALGLVIGSVVVFGSQIKLRMMPYAERNQFAVEITLTPGSGLDETKSIVDSVCRQLNADPRVVSVTSFVGCSSPRFHAAYAPKPGGRNYAQLIVNTTSDKDTENLLDELEPMSDRFPNAFVKFKQLDYQNFTPFEYRFYGENADSLRRVANDVMNRMRQDSRVMNVKTDWENPHPYVDVELDPVKAQQLGFSRTLTELQLMMNTGDVQVGDVWEGKYNLPIVLKDAASDSLKMAGLGDVYLSSPITTAPLRQFADVRPEWGATNILHRNGVRCITVNIEAKRGVYTNALHNYYGEMIASEITLPPGVRFEVGGEPENDMEMGGDIITGLAVAIVLIFFFLLFNFKNYKIAFVCIFAMLLCVPATLFGLWLMGRPVGFTSVFGIITLMGMIMRNEILIFEHANDKMRHGWSAREAAFDAGRRRMVPIFLTTATTAVGVVPMIIAATSFWMPVGVSICAGGICALVLVVTVLPVVYWKIKDKKSK